MARPRCQPSQAGCRHPASRDDDLMPDAGYAELLTLVLRGEIELEIAIFLGIGRQLIGANIDLTPLEALSNIPNCQKVRAPGRE